MYEIELIFHQANWKGGVKNLTVDQKLRNP